MFDSKPHLCSSDKRCLALSHLSLQVHLARLGPYNRLFHNRLAPTALASCTVVLLGSTSRTCFRRHKQRGWDSEGGRGCACAYQHNCDSIESRIFREAIVFTALAINLLLISAGVAWDVRLLIQQRKRDEEELEELGEGSTLCFANHATIILFLDTDLFSEGTVSTNAEQLDTFDGEVQLGMVGIDEVANPVFATNDIAMDSLGGESSAYVLRLRVAPRTHSGESSAFSSFSCLTILVAAFCARWPAQQRWSTQAPSRLHRMSLCSLLHPLWRLTARGTSTPAPAKQRQ